MKNWKTTIGGALGAFGVALAAIDPNWAKCGALLGALGIFLSSLFAKDSEEKVSEVVKDMVKDKKLMLGIMGGLLIIFAAGCRWSFIR